MLLADGALLLDVRRKEDPAAPLDHAVRISPDQIPEHLAGFTRDVPIVLACT
jgi:rhodanese-related sulfurtransferase